MQADEPNNTALLGSSGDMARAIEDEDDAAYVCVHTVFTKKSEQSAIISYSRMPTLQMSRVWLCPTSLSSLL